MLTLRASVLMATLTVVILACACSDDDGPSSPYKLGYVDCFTVGAAGQVCDIWTMDADGSDKTRITGGDENLLGPLWSPDASRILLYLPDESGNGDIYVMNADASDRVRLTTGGAIPHAWSPDGSQIEFTPISIKNTDIHVMNADATSVRQLTDDPGTDSFGEWSPDGGRIAFTSDRGGSSNIYVMNADGTHETQLTRRPGNHFAPVWSPDGTRIAFISDRDGNPGVYVMESDGTNPIRLTRNEGADYFGAWSPDGKQVAYTNCPDPNAEYQICDAYVVFSDGTLFSPRTDLGLHVRDLAWSPDGKLIAFTAGEEVWVMNADGSDQKRLTDSGAGAPVWLPLSAPY